MLQHKLINQLARVLLGASLWLLPCTTRAQTSFEAEEITATLRPAPVITLPGGVNRGVDCNSPVEWDGAGNLIVFTSWQEIYRTTGRDLFSLAAPALPVFIVHAPGTPGGKWLEATYRNNDGVLYGWYHNETPRLCSNNSLTVPRIGAMISRDDGITWQDLGIILEAPADALNCSSQNRYFAGGNGDFSVILDQERQYFYFLFSTYHRQPNEQGVATARLSYADLDAPVGKVWKWHNAGWNEPGLRGRVTPVFPALIDWHRSNANAFWGAAVHYNAYLDRYVMLLNHATDREWAQEGIYICYNQNLADPQGWSAPQRLPLFPARSSFYPEIIGTYPSENDKLTGQVARFFLSGTSTWEIVFQRPDTCGNLLRTANANPSCDPSLVGPAPLRPARGAQSYPQRDNF